MCTICHAAAFVIVNIVFKSNYSTLNTSVVECGRNKQPIGTSGGLDACQLRLGYARGLVYVSTWYDGRACEWWLS